MTALLVHPSALALLPLSNSSSSPTPTPIPTPTSLPLPSRFPANATPRAAAGNGSVYLFARGDPHVWEYDARGRRTSEMVVDGGVVDVVVVGAAVCVLVREGREGDTAEEKGYGEDFEGLKVAVMRKRSGAKKWECEMTLEAPENMAAMVAEGSVLVLVGAEAWVYDLAAGSDHTAIGVQTTARCAALVKRKNGFCLAVPSSCGLQYIPLVAGSSSTTTTVRIPEADAITRMAASGPRLAVSVGSSVVIVEADGSTETVSLPGRMDALAWVDGKLVATINNTVWVHGFKDGATTEVRTEQPVLGIHAIPPRVSSKTSERVLGDSSVPNHAKQKKQDKEDNGGEGAGDKENAGDDNDKDGVGKIPPAVDKNTFGKPPKPRERTVSNGKMAPPPLPLLKANSKAPVKPANPLERVAQRPLATPSNPMLAARPVTQGTGDTLRIRPPAILEMEQEHPSPATTMALSPMPPTPNANPNSSGGPGWEAYNEMRKEIANLQLDMLRMGRGLKNEIRSAVAPLVEELRKSRETIARQEAELERLRRGF